MNSCVLTSVLPGKSSAPFEAVKKFPEVKSAHLVLGRYGIAAFAEAPTRKDLSTLSAKVNAIPETKSTEKMIEA